ncbi:hypothetical protein SpAn4DRAFT_4328 [Sporomusa ovata]|uniref:Uncharacterized protein n=2 Tax=Sporomusa ovata TaxID=2378 RepID=A0A0U1L7W4_9FIRM|nr:hypothetical protein [Sporomusa ovata]CQR74964.1 hypothetical protein SpAn4DRAFT_4328 [Sporomusa ovata]
MESGGSVESLAAKIGDAVRKSKIMGEETETVEETQESGDLGNGQ